MAIIPASTVAAAELAASSAAVPLDVERLSERVAGVRAEIGRAIFGQAEVIDQALITLLSGGHMLLVGVPGLGKSRLVETLGSCSAWPPSGCSSRPT